MFDIQINLISKYLNLYDLVALSLSSKIFHEPKIKNGFSPHSFVNANKSNVLSQYGFNVKSFDIFLQKFGLVLSGSTVIQFLNGNRYDGSDMDLYRNSFTIGVEGKIYYI